MPLPPCMSRAIRAISSALPQLLRLIRSEEHTSELQSRSDLVCRLLLEKKKKKTDMKHESHTEPTHRISHSTQYDRTATSYPSASYRSASRHACSADRKIPALTVPFVA